MRADEALVARGLAPSRSRAQAEIKAGHVVMDGAQVRKPSQKVPDNAALTLTGQVTRWVSRAGEKLAHGLAHFDIDVTDKVALDVGASTGGFVEVLLDAGAASVYAVDVGTGQLHPSLLGDARVVSLEQTDARNLSAELIKTAPEIVTCDASFIGLAKVIAVPLLLAVPGAHFVGLIKPQFEVGRAHIGKNGIVRTDAPVAACRQEIESFLVGQGWRILGQTLSPIKGGDGNQEYLIAAIKEGEQP